MNIKNLADLKKYLAKTNLKDIFFAVTFPKDALAVEELLPYKIICFDDQPLDTIICNSTDLFSLLKNTKDDPKRRSTAVLLKHPLTKKYIASFQYKKPQILVYKPSPSLEKICQNNGWKLLANKSKLNRFFENKINFSHLLNDLNIPQPDFFIQKLFEIDYHDYAKKFDGSFFIQFPRGFAGSSTFLINNSSDLEKIKQNYLNYPAKISRKINGPTYTLNACIISKKVNKNNIVIQKPFFQITNIPELNNSPGGTCGNIYSDNPNIKLNLKSIYKDVQKYGKYLAKKGYLGIFGLDFVVDQKNHQHYFIECNPRLTASIPMISKLQIINNQIPLLILHILELSGHEYKLAESAIKKINSDPYFGSQIIFRNTTPTNQKPPLNYRSGIYLSKYKIKDIYQLKDYVQNKSSSIKYIRPGKDISDITKKDKEFLVICAAKNKLISPGIEYLRIQSLI